MSKGGGLLETISNEPVDQLEDELKLLDFSHYPLPKKEKNTLRLFYNNINGLEINVAVETILNN